MPRRSEAPPDQIENLAQEVLCLSREILVLRETLDEIREYLQWITRNNGSKPCCAEAGQRSRSIRTSLVVPGTGPARTGSAGAAHAGRIGWTRELESENCEGFY